MKFTVSSLVLALGSAAAMSNADFHHAMSTTASLHYAHFNTLNAVGKFNDGMNMLRERKFTTLAASQACTDAMANMEKESASLAEDPAMANMGAVFDSDNLSEAEMTKGLDTLCTSSAYQKMQTLWRKVDNACSPDDLGALAMMGIVFDIACVKRNGKYCMVVMKSMEDAEMGGAKAEAALTKMCPNSGCIVDMMEAMSGMLPAAEMKKGIEQAKMMVGVMCLKSDGKYCMPVVAAAGEDPTKMCAGTCHRDFVNTILALVDKNPEVCEGSASPMRRRLLGATGTSGTGSSGTGTSATGTSATGTSATGTSATGTSATGTSATGGGSSATGTTTIDEVDYVDEIEGEEGNMFAMGCGKGRKTMEAMLKVMCLKNAAGKFCVEAMDMDDSTGAEETDVCPDMLCGATDCTPACKTEIESKAKGLGCCLGALVKEFAPIVEANPLPATGVTDGSINEEVMMGHMFTCASKFAVDVCKATMPTETCTPNPAWKGGSTAGAGGDAGMDAVMNGGAEVSAASTDKSIFAGMVLAVAALFVNWL